MRTPLVEQHFDHAIAVGILPRHGSADHMFADVCMVTVTGPWRPKGIEVINRARDYALLELQP